MCSHTHTHPCPLEGPQREWHVVNTLFGITGAEQQPGKQSTEAREHTNMWDCKIIRGRRGRQGQIMGCQIYSVLLFITWHVYPCVCSLLCRSIYYEKTDTKACTTSPLCFSVVWCSYKHPACSLPCFVSRNATPLHVFSGNVLRCHVPISFFVWILTVKANNTPPRPRHIHPSEPFLSLPLVLSSHLIPHLLVFPNPFSSFFGPVSSLSIIVYLHSVHFLPSLMALRWGVLLVRNCNEDWNTISWLATVSFLHHPVLLGSDRCCCCCFGFPVCSYWCVSLSLSRYC